MNAALWRGRLTRLRTGQGAMARLSRGILGSGGVWIIRLATTIGMSFLLGHLLGPTEYGVYANVVANVTLFAPLCSLGYDMLATREFAAARAGEEIEREAALARTLPWVVWRSAALMLLLFVPLSIAYNVYSGKGFEWTVLLEALGIALTAQMRLVQGSLRGLGQVSLGQLYQLVVPPVLNLVLFVALLAVFRPSAMLGIATFVGGLVLVYPLAARAVRKLASSISATASPATRKAWRRAALVLGVTQIMAVANDQLPLVLTGWLRDSTQVGLLDIARRFALFASIALNVIQLPLGPIMAEMYRKGDMAGFRRVALQTTYVGVGISLFITLVYALIGHQLLHVIGPAFGEAWAAMLVMCLGYVINTMTGPVPMALTMTGHENDAVRGIAAGITINFLTCIALVPWLGHLGAAIGSVAGQFVWNVLLAIIVRRRFGMALDIFALFERRATPPAR